MTSPRYWRKDLVVDGGRAAGSMRDHDSCWGPVVLYDLLDFSSVPLTTDLDVVLLPVLRCCRLVLQRSLQKCP